MTKVSVIGAGAWGTALACIARRAGHDVSLWALEPEVVDAINSGRGNPTFLPDIKLDPGIHATANLGEAVQESDVILTVVPSQFFRGVAKDMAAHLPAKAPILLCSKGIENKTGALMTEIAAEILTRSPILVLSGPSFARETVEGSPTAVALAGTDAALCEKVTGMLGTPHFRPYPMDDPIGAEIGGAVKNVLAIACGIVTGCKLGDNTRAALITRGLSEMARLGVAKGARTRTFMGLSGLGDLTLTCNGPQSRNMSLGIALGEGRKLEDILAERNSVAEGVQTAPAIIKLAAELGVELPIIEAVYQVLHEGADIRQSIDDLLNRPFTPEFEGLD
jgi:glycerol-3-phosphate dehydrogenase (NAD(P)+)